MNRSPFTNPTTPETAVIEQRLASPQFVPSAQPLLFPKDEKARIQAVQIELRAFFGACVEEFGGSFALVRALHRADSYEGRINDAIRGEADRAIQWEWWAPMLLVPTLSRRIAAWFSEFAGRAQTFNDEQMGVAALAVLREMCSDPDMLAVAEKKMARQLGSTAERVKL